VRTEGERQRDAQQRRNWPCSTVTRRTGNRPSAQSPPHNEANKKSFFRLINSEKVNETRAKSRYEQEKQFSPENARSNTDPTTSAGTKFHQYLRALLAFARPITATSCATSYENDNGVIYDFRENSSTRVGRI